MSELTIEQLELEVQSSSTSAVSGIDALSASLSKLKSATKGGVGLTSVASSVRKLDTALKSLDSSTTTKINSLSNSLQRLKNLGTVKISPTIANQLVNIGYAAEVISDVDFSGISDIGEALKPLSTFKASGFTSAVSALKSLPKLSETLGSMDISKFTNQIQQLSTALSPLATQLNTISTAYSRLPSNINKAVVATDELTKANTKASSSYINLWAKCRLAVTAVKSVANVIASWINSSNTYIEDLNLFTVSMGQYAEEAQNYANAASGALGINPGDFMRNEGVFNTIIEGFGVASDKAYLMSKNLTQLGYDISSFYNISVEDAMQKLQSGISGELEPLRRLGYDLSVARLQEEALALGIDKSVSSMTQAEKSQLRYYAILTQVTDAQGDMARTLESPSNQLRVLQAQVDLLSRSLGNLFLPILKAIIPYITAAVKLIRYLIDAVGSLFGFKLSDFTGSLDSASSSIGSAASGIDDVTDGLSDASDTAKKLKNSLLGIDELNVISQDTSSSSGSDSTGLSGGDLGITLPEYDFFDSAASNKVNEIFEKMKEHLNEALAIIGSIGAGLLAWKIAKGVTDFFTMLSNFKGFSGGGAFLGLTMLLADMNEFSKYLNDFLENGASFTNVSGMISEFAGMLGDAFILLGNVKLGGALKIVQGVGEIITAISDIANNGVSWDNVRTAIRGVSNIAIGLGLITGNFQVAGVGLVLQGLITVIPQLKNVITAIKTDDWSVVDWSDLVIGAIEVIGGIALAFGAFKGLGAVGKITQAGITISEVGTATTSTSGATEVLNTASSGFSTKLASLAKNLLVGIAIIAEVAAAALLIVGAIALLGVELNLVAQAWTPVIANGGTVAIALVAGTAILVAVGLVTAALGTAGTAIVAQIGLGIAILAELSVATDLFLAEILIIGILLDEIYKAWTPVLNNGDVIATAIATGTALLIGIGMVTAALGVATVATAGLLPLAIGLGTALLVEMAAATVLFIESLVAVATELNDNLSPALIDLNDKLPGLTENMSNFVDFMTEFAGQVVRYTEANAVAGLAATIDTIIGWFTEDPIDKLANDVNDISSQTKTLNEKLRIAVPELEEAVDLLESYQSFLGQMETLTNSNVQLSTGSFVNMKEVGQSIVTGFVDGIKSKSSDFSNAATALVNGFKTNLNNKANECQSSMISWANKLKNWFTQSSFGGINAETWKTYAKGIVTGFSTGITTYYNSSKSSMTTWGTNVKNWFNNANGRSLQSEFEDIGRNVIQGFINGSSNSYLWSVAKGKIEQFGREIIAAGKKGLDERSPSKAFKEIGSFVIEGFNIGLESMMSSSYSLMNKWTDGVSAYAPTLALAVDSSQLASLDSTPSISRNVVADVRSSYTVTTNDFTDGIETFYREYVEPTFKSMAADVKRQADKNEQTIVKVGNRTVNDAVTTQKKANGYVFVK